MFQEESKEGKSAMFPEEPRLGIGVIAKMSLFEKERDSARDTGETGERWGSARVNI